MHRLYRQYNDQHSIINQYISISINQLTCINRSIFHNCNRVLSVAITNQLQLLIDDKQLIDVIPCAYGAIADIVTCNGTL